MDCQVHGKGKTQNDQKSQGKRKGQGKMREKEIKIRKTGWEKNADEGLVIERGKGMLKEGRDRWELPIMANAEVFYV